MLSSKTVNLFSKLQNLMKSIVGFLSRPHGFNVLSTLVESKEYKIIHIFTHKLNPKSQDPNRSIRNDYPMFEDLCKEKEIPLTAVDSKEDILIVPNCDFIIEISWRYLIPQDIVKKSKIGAFGIHRGKLPQYAGAEPIKQALENHEKEIILSAHQLADEIDMGGTITSISHPVNYNEDKSLDENIQRLRDEITPLFSKLSLKTLKLLENN